MSLLLHALQQLADRNVPIVPAASARSSARQAARRGATEAVVRDEACDDLPLPELEPEAADVLVTLPDFAQLSAYEPVAYVESASSYEVACEDELDLPDVQESELAAPAPSEPEPVLDWVAPLRPLAPDWEQAEIHRRAAEFNRPAVPRFNPAPFPPAEPKSAPQYFKPIAVSDDVAAVRDEILSRLAARETRVVALAHADRAGEDSTVVAELAKAMVGFLPGEVLVIDARNRGAGWSGKLGCERSDGAEELFLGLASLETVKRSTSWLGLDAVPAGPHRREIQLARSADIEQAVDACRQQYAIVLIDLGSVDDTHVAPVARRCDATYLIVRLGETERQHARTALARLQYAGVHPLSCILTKAAPRG